MGEEETKKFFSQKNFLNTYRRIFLQDLEFIERDLARVKRAYPPSESRIFIHAINRLSQTIPQLLSPLEIPPQLLEVVDRTISLGGPKVETSLKLAKNIFEGNFFPGQLDTSLEVSLKVPMIFLTEGVVTMEGISKVSVDDSGIVSIFFEGPIRAFGGTTSALSIVILDYLRQIAGLKSFQISEEEILRWFREIKLYDRGHARLQYLASENEIRAALEDLPIRIQSSGLRHLPLPLSYQVPGLNHTFVRGGGCLVLSEGLIPKINKIKNFITLTSIQGWDGVVSKIQQAALDKGKDLKQETPIFKGEDHSFDQEEDFHEERQGFLVGRPVFGITGVKGSFRVVLGRTRFMGLLSMGVHPVSSFLFNCFLGVGTQIKMEEPSKGGVVTFSEDLEGPLVELDDGSLIRLDSKEKFEQIKGHIKFIHDCGEILISPGDYLYQGKPLGGIPRSQVEFLSRLKEGGIELNFDPPTPLASEKSFDLGFGDHPKYTPFLNDLSWEEYAFIRENLSLQGFYVGDEIQIFDPSKKFLDLLRGLWLEFTVLKQTGINLGDSSSSIRRYFALKREGDYLLPLEVKIPKKGKVCSESLSLILGRKVFFKSDHWVAVRMGRPEKGKPREKAGGKLAPHGVLKSSSRDARRNLLKSIPEKITGEKYICEECTFSNNRATVFPICDVCGKKTKHSGRKTRLPYKVDYKEVYSKISERSGLPLPPLIRGMESRFPRADAQELLEKAFFRAQEGLVVFRDGTTRFDMTNVPLTHFIPREINLSLEECKSMGYTHASDGSVLNSINQVVQLFPQDIIIPEGGLSFLERVKNYCSKIASHIGLEISPETLKKNYVLVNSPHTSIGIVARVIGTTKALVCFQHPFLIANKRRNSDGDEDSITLFIQALLDYSPSLLEKTTGNKMDTPVNILKVLNPKEIDSEGKAIYSAKIFLEEERDALLSGDLSLLSNFDSFEDIRQLEYTHSGVPLDSEDINFTSAYKEETTFQEKLDLQLSILKKLKGLSSEKVVLGLLESHIFPDIIGNMRGYFIQSLRCTKCKRSYNSFLMYNNCVCGNPLVQTIHPSSIVKYLGIAKKLVSEFCEKDQYTSSRLKVLIQELDSCF